MGKLFALSLILVSIFLFLCGYLISTSFYINKHHIKYRIKQMFPYELNYPNTFKNNIYGNIFFIISFVCLIAFYICYYTIIGNFHSPINISLIALSIVATLLTYVVMLMPLRYLRMHMFASLSLLIISLMITCFNGILAYQSFKSLFDSSDQLLSIISLIVCVVLATIMLLLILNPKTNYQIYMQKKINEKGEEIYVRPNFIPMAFAEWWSIINLLISSLPLLLLLFI